MGEALEKRAWHYFVDQEGHFWHEGVEMDDPQILHFFMKDLEKRPDSEIKHRYEVICMGELCIITAQDVPYVIQWFEEKPEGLELIFPGNYREILNPETLFIGEENVPYTRIRDGRFLARFHRKAYWEFAKKVEYDQVTDQYFVEMSQKKVILEKRRS